MGKWTVLGVCATLMSLGMGSASALAAGALDELSAEDQAKVRNGEQVTVTAPGGTSPWPKMWVYQRVEATPEEAMAVFADYDRQKEYMSDLLFSKVKARLDRVTADVAYTVATHFVFHPRENYVTRSRVSAYDGGASYRLDWKLVSANQIRDTVGNARFERLGSGTLVAYHNFITPPSIAGSQGSKAVAGTQATVRALARRIDRLRAEDQALLQEELAALREALSGS